MAIAGVQSGYSNVIGATVGAPAVTIVPPVIASVQSEYLTTDQVQIRATAYDQNAIDYFDNIVFECSTDSAFSNVVKTVRVPLPPKIAGMQSIVATFGQLASGRYTFRAYYQ